MTGFNRGFALASQFTRKTPAQACNYAGFVIAIKAQKNTAFVTPQTVDSELAVISMPVIGVRGKPLKNRKNFFGKVGTAKGSELHEVPLVVLIIAARARPGSKYNELTNNRYALPSWPFKGINKRAGAWLMSTLVNSMVKNRHRSGHFEAAGWIDSIRILLLVDKGRAGGFAKATDYADYGSPHGLGDASPAKEGYAASCTIENDVGLEGQNAANHNRGLMIQAPALQSAVDEVGREDLNYFLQKTGREELEIPVNNAWK